MEQPLRVLHVFGRLDMGGAENLVMSIYRQTDRTKVQFDFAVHGMDIGFFEPEIESLGGRVYHDIPRYRICNYYAYKRAWRKFLAAHEYGVIHIHTTNSALPILLEAKRRGIERRILHAHNTGEENAVRILHVKMIRPLLRHYATDLLAASDSAGVFTFKSGYSVKENAIHADRFRFKPEVRQAIRREMGWESDFVVCHIGRFHSQKNHSFLLKVFKQFAEQVPDAKLVSIGDGGLRAQIEHDILAYGISDKVSLLGVRGDVSALLQAADVFVLPSLYEGLGIVAVEAQASGLPTFLSDTIPEEARIVNELVIFLPIDRGVEPWVSALEAAADKPVPRRDTFEEIRAAGFDIVATARWYESFYTSQCKGDR